ncbi:MAG: hypothetical protein U5K00_22290 [Melioribacteraceae bacterium]|nr:hypothetical protein [Melioribacteraceae bacterium]
MRNEFYFNYKIKERLSKGSSLKICLIAEGKAELYFRGGPTWEWIPLPDMQSLTPPAVTLENKDKSELTEKKELLKTSASSHALESYSECTQSFR